MNAVVKKRVVMALADVLAVFSLIIAFWCVFYKLRSFFNNALDKISVLAVESTFFRGNSFNILKCNPCNLISNNFSHDENLFKNDRFEVKPSNMQLPDFIKNSNQKPCQDDNQTKYKIIENHFSGGIKCENFYVKNSTGLEINFADELKKPASVKFNNSNDPQVLIFHTHTSESYMENDQDFFYESFYPRSLENSKNVTAVGQAVCDKLCENGIKAIHDTTYHDNPTYNGSYARSAKTVKSLLEKYPSIQMVIDIHRDSMGNNSTGKMKPVFKYKDKKAAQLMIISGCDSDNKLGFPNWNQNLRLALKVQKYAESMFPGITRPLNFAKVRYNEHLTPGSLLIEIGSDVNTLEEAVYTGSMLGESLSAMIKDIKKNGG